MIESRYTMRESEDTVMEIETLRNFLAVAQEENITRSSGIPAPDSHAFTPDTGSGGGVRQKASYSGKRRITLTQDGILFRKRALKSFPLWTRPMQK